MPTNKIFNLLKGKKNKNRTNKKKKFFNIYFVNDEKAFH